MDFKRCVHNQKVLIFLNRNYEYSKTGLSHYFEKQNVLYKLNVEEKEKKKKEITRNFVEFEYMDDNEIIIIIEHW